MTKVQLLQNLSIATGLQKAQVCYLLDSLTGACRSALKAGESFEIPGIVKLKVVKKPASQATTRMNPFTKAMMEVPAKPESKKVKASPVKSLRDEIG